MKNFAKLSAILLLVASSASAQVVELSREVRDRVVQQVNLALNWVPEPEFGGFYAAQVAGIYDKNGLKVEIIPGGAGSPTVQMLGAGKVTFAVTSGGEIAIARSMKSDVVAIYSVFEKSPMGIMAHKSRNLKDLGALFAEKGTVALQKGQAYFDFLQKKYNFEKVQIVPYTGGVTEFLRNPLFSQQGFIFSEPLTAKAAGVEADFFLFADIGYNPYTEVLAVQGDTLKKNILVVKAMVDSVREGWELYLKDPAPANKLMATLNKAMNAATFEAGAEAQKVLIGSGQMSEERWKEHIGQLKAAKSITKDVDPASCFKNFP